MVKLIYCDVNTIVESELLAMVQLLPVKMQEYISRFRYTADKKLCLVGRLMLLKVLHEEKTPDLINEWKVGLNNKPFIDRWKAFNISHSGSVVVFCYGDSLVGVDVEQISNSNYLELNEFLHQDEYQYISTSRNPNTAFYNVWVRKEAFLKAIGLGLVNQIADYNCLPDVIYYNQLRWHLKRIVLNPSYCCCVCSLGNEVVQVGKFILTFKGVQLAV